MREFIWITLIPGLLRFFAQELVNLLLCGRAFSNVFDDDLELDSGNGSATLLKGIKGQCDVGLLSLFEHYNICKVSADPDPDPDPDTSGSLIISTYCTCHQQHTCAYNRRK